MIYFYLGKPKCGKSQIVENIINNNLQGTTLYIGTLPVNSYYEETIRQHKERRPSEWKLIELSYDPHNDVETVFRETYMHQNILFDGLSFYIQRQYIMFKDIMQEYEERTIDYLRTFALKEQRIFIVDTPVPKIYPEVCKKSLHWLHLQIMRNSEAIYYVENSVPIQIGYREGIKLDKIS